MNKKLIWLLVILAVVLLGRNTKGQSLTPIVYEEPKRDSLDVWIDLLATKEGCPNAGMIDNNNEKSYGILCFQEKTFRSYAKQFKMFPNAEYKEVMNFIADETIQKKLARKMIEYDYGNWRHWKTTVEAKIGKPPLK